ncbi:MAG: hypothetical protein JWN81_657, partial [Solirubrobacterales bacterium]|nr:hypothetical protein [Solirubrobacterales bacterium]
MFGLGGRLVHSLPGLLAAACAMSLALAFGLSSVAYAAAPLPGSYTGAIPGNGTGLKFFVSADSAHLQDVYIPATSLQCTGEGAATGVDHLEAADVTLESGGSLASTTTKEGILEGHHVVFTYTFSGQFNVNGEEASGTYREDIAYEGSTRKCTTNSQPWSAKRDSQPTQTTAPPPPGSYTGAIPGNGTGLKLFVSADSAHLQDVYIPATSLQCTGEGAATGVDHLEAAEVTLESGTSGTSFAKATTEKGKLEGHPVVFTFTFSGHFHSLNSSEVERAAGFYREDVTYEGSTRRCTTNNQSFSATRDSQPTQTTAPPPPGSYTGAIPGNGTGLKFFVSGNSTHVQDVYIPATSLQCTGEGAATGVDHLEAAEVTIKVVTSGRWFTKKATEKGILGGHPVVFTFTFSGHFHSLNSSEV